VLHCDDSSRYHARWNGRDRRKFALDRRKPQPSPGRGENRHQSMAGSPELVRGGGSLRAGSAGPIGFQS
jgi:hypothetical protein